MIKLRRLFKEVLKAFKEDRGVAFLKDYGDTLTEGKVLLGTHKDGSSVLITSLGGSSYKYYETDPDTGVTSKHEGSIERFEGYKFKELNVGTYEDWEKSVEVREDKAKLGTLRHCDVFVYDSDNDKLKLKLWRYANNMEYTHEVYTRAVNTDIDTCVTDYVKRLFEDYAGCVVADLTLLSSEVNSEGKDLRTYELQYFVTPNTDEGNLKAVEEMVGYIR